MNYKRIYEEFIADRLSKQAIDGYFEIHHILPKCLGGDDKPTNLIKLTASDHLFAHQLLARAYKDTKHAYALWGAVLILCRDFLTRGSRRRGQLSVMGAEGLKYRKGIDAARKIRVENFSGLNHPSSDHTVYTFRNIDGCEFVGTRLDFCARFDVDPGSIPRLISDETAKTKSGWYVFDDKKPEAQRASESDPIKYQFKNVNGATYRGTRRNFQRKTNTEWWLVDAIVDSAAASPSGWMI